MPRPAEFGWAVMHYDQPVLHAYVPDATGKALCGEKNLVARGYNLVKIVNTSTSLRRCKKCWPYRTEQ